MVRIRRFGVIRTATAVAAMFALVILVGTLIIGVPIALLAGAAGRNSGEAAGIMGVGVVGVVLFGLFGAVAYGIGGWIVTAIACAIYNVVAGWFGGIEVQLENTAPPSTPTWGGPSGGYGPSVYSPQPGYGPGPGYQPPVTGQPPAQFPQQYPPQYPPTAPG